MTVILVSTLVLLGTGCARAKVATVDQPAPRAHDVLTVPAPAPSVTASVVPDRVPENVPPAAVLVTARPAEIHGPPPPAQVERVGVPPDRLHVWMPGRWAWNGSWEWVPGTWALAPSEGASWVPGRWVRRNEGWIWIRGYWRET